MPITALRPSPQGLPALTETLPQLGMLEVSLRTGIALALGVVLAIVYRATHKSLSYSQSFTQTIVFVAVIVALVMMTVGSSLATAFTLVGALSIIRFRTVVKDTRDTAFVFASLALGMAAGIGYWQLAAIGTGVLTLLALALHATNFGALHRSEFLLRFTFDQAKDSATYLQTLAELARRTNLLHVEPSGDGRSLRLTYDVTLARATSAQQLTAALTRLDGVREIALLVSKNDVDF